MAEHDLTEVLTEAELAEIADSLVHTNGSLVILPRLLATVKYTRGLLRLAQGEAEQLKAALSKRKGGAGEAKPLKWCDVGARDEMADAGSLLELWTTSFASDDGVGWWVQDHDGNTLAQDMETRLTREAAKSAAVAAARKLLTDALAQLGGD